MARRFSSALSSPNLLVALQAAIHTLSPNKYGDAVDNLKLSAESEGNDETVVEGKVIDLPTSW